jgi:hypothetical protein
MRSFCIAIVAASLALAPAVSAQPLAPGKPAGVHAARNGATTGLLIAGVAVVAGIIVLAVSTGGDNNTGVLVPSPTTGTTS